MQFKIDSIVLRKPKEEDANGFIEICSEKDTMKYYGVSGADIDTYEKAMKQIEWCNSLFQNNSGRWIITIDGKDQYIGDIGFHNFQENNKKVEIGYRLKQAYWGKGIMSKCIQKLVKYGFSELGYNRVEAYVDHRNEASAHLLRKNGFQFEGTLRECEFEHGSYVDLDVYSILRREYKKEENKLSQEVIDEEEN